MQAFQTPTFFALLMELCPLDLNRRVISEPTWLAEGLPVALGLKYARGVLRALEHVHAQGIVPRQKAPAGGDRQRCSAT